MVAFSNTKGNLDISQIEAMEEFVGLRFPEEYKNHLLKYNGGRCEPNVFSFVENGIRTTSALDWFFAIYDGEYNRLRDYLEIYKLDQKRMPNHMLPFASDVVGNAICLSCGEDDYGKVYLWDHEREVDYMISTDDDYSNLYIITNSFDEFLENLQYGEDIRLE